MASIGTDELPFILAFASAPVSLHLLPYMSSRFSSPIIWVEIHYCRACSHTTVHTQDSHSSFILCIWQDYWTYILVRTYTFDSSVFTLPYILPFERSDCSGNYVIHFRYELLCFGIPWIIILIHTKHTLFCYHEAYNQCIQAYQLHYIIPLPDKILLRHTYVATFGTTYYASSCLDLLFWDSAYLISLSWSTLSMHLCISIYTLYVYIHFSYSSLRYSSLREYPPNEHYTFVTLSHLRPILYLPSLFCIYFHFYTLILLLVWISLSNILSILLGTFLCHC